MNKQAKTIHKSINAIFLFVILGLLAYIGAREGSDEEDYTRKREYDIKPISVEQVEVTDELRELFPEYVLDESYKKKVMYALEIEVVNKDCEGLYSYEYDYIIVKSPEGAYYDNTTPEYYTYDVEGSKPYCEVLPPFFAQKVTFYVVMSEEDVPEQLYLYKNYDSEEYVAIDMP